MRSFISAIAILFMANTVSYGQTPVNDTHPAATIYIIDPQTNQEILAQSDAAVLFKDAFIDLVKNTNEARMAAHAPGHKTIVITQAAPSQGNAFQITQQARYMNQDMMVYTFSYNVDQNTLYFQDPNTQSWNPVLIQGYNVVNLNNCLALGKFNDLQTADNNTQANDNGDADNAVQVQAQTPPPALQEYQQPPCPVDGYLWQPGYWAFNQYNGGYYWVAGTWVAPPTPGYLWTPPYWGYEGSVYLFHRGYWGVEIGFYGGINYGYGYGGHGFYGGEWAGGHFRYNTAVVNVNTTVVHNTYVDRTVIVNHTTINNTTVNNRTSFNGPGGVTAKPTPTELAVASKPHITDNSQDTKTPASAFKVQGHAAQTAERTAIPANTNTKTTANSSNTFRTPADATGAQKTPANTVNQPKTAANNAPAVKGPNGAPAVPTVPGKGPNAPKVGGNNQQGGNNGRRGNKQQGRNQNNQQSNKKNQ